MVTASVLISAQNDILAYTHGCNVSPPPPPPPPHTHSLSHPQAFVDGGGGGGGSGFLFAGFCCCSCWGFVCFIHHQLESWYNQQIWCSVTCDVTWQTIYKARHPKLARALEIRGEKNTDSLHILIISVLFFHSCQHSSIPLGGCGAAAEGPDQSPSRIAQQGVPPEALPLCALLLAQQQPQDLQWALCRVLP